jgi:hypothetical protein
MAIGTLAAIGIGLAGAGAVASSSAQKSAANKASQVAADTSASNNALAQNIYNQNAATLSPFVQRGNAAGGAMNALLGLGGSATNSAATMPAPGMQGLPTGQGYGVADWNANNGAPFQRDGINDYSQIGAYGWGGVTPDAFANWGGMDANGLTNFGPTAQAGQAQMPTGQSAQSAAEDAFNIFKSSTGYQSRLKEGANAVNSMWAGSGAVKSGAAGKAFERFGQDFASNEFGNYMNYLGNQQGVGLGAASAQAGVGQNYVNTISNNNNNAGTAAANAALTKGNNSFGNVLGMIGGGLFGYGR